MNVLKQFLRQIPLWAYLLVLAAIFVNSVYFVFTFEAYVINSKWPFAPLFTWSVYVIMLIFGVVSLYVLYKKPGNHAVNLFFICIQIFVIMVNAGNLFVSKPLVNVVNVIFHLGSCLIGAVLINFHLIFPKPVKPYQKIKHLPWLVYILSILVFLGYSSSYLYDVKIGLTEDSVFFLFELIALWWMAFSFLIALIIAVYQFFTLKDTLSRYQVLILIIGSFFGTITPVGLAVFYDHILQMTFKNPNPIIISQGIGSMILVGCFLIAIFRYRIWDIEVFIRKALLYLGATMIIILTYLFLIWIVDRLIISENNIVRFLILGVSVIIFLVLRDRIQRMIDRLFHRETYDSASVVSDFEEKLAGIYRFDELKQKIVQSLDDIFHFKFFVFILNKDNLVYEPVYILGIDDPGISAEYKITAEIEDKLRGSKVFSPEEVNNKPQILEMIKGDLIVPLVSESKPNGFFICGQKKSERLYSRQDINVLTLLARRVVALLHTASLYQKDLDRQLMLERERARISQDMHDDIGAGLTKIAMISEAPVKMQDAGCKMQDAGCKMQDAGNWIQDAGYKMQDAGNWEPGTGNLLLDRLQRIATSSREMISRLNVIVWALNPKYDNLESLISYLRRYFGEYLENFGIRFITDLPEQIPECSITPDTRRNIFYAIQEAIHNAVKHSCCSEIRLLVKNNQHEMEITITDNGKGFNAVKPGSGGNGLLNMRKRAEEMGGSVEIQSLPGQGTRVYFDIRVM